MLAWKKCVRKIDVSISLIIFLKNLFPSFMGNQFTEIDHFFFCEVSYIFSVSYIIIGNFVIGRWSEMSLEMVPECSRM